MSIEVEIYCTCELCGAEVREHEANVVCDECFEKVRDVVAPGYHLITESGIYCGKEKCEIGTQGSIDTIVFCPFCGDRLVR